MINFDSFLYQSSYAPPLPSQVTVNKSRRCHTFYYLSLIVGGSLAALPAFAIETSPSNADLPSVTLPKITVTATRLPTTISNTIAQTQVIDSEALRHYQGQTALDIIKRQPGISFKQNGGIGTSSSFYMRGYDSKSILVLIDGVRYSSISAGGATLNLLPAEQIDRVEILYGASGTSIYGADAMGGVIQVFTKGNNVDNSQLSLTGGIGSNNHYLYGATAQYSNDQGTRFSLSASHNETDGINATLPNPSNPYSSYNPDEDGFDSDNYSLHLNQTFNNSVDVGISGLYSKSTTEYDNGPSAGTDDTAAHQKNGSAQAYIDWHYAPQSSVKLSYGQSIDETEDPAYSSNFDSKQRQIGLIGSHTISEVGQVIYGTEHLTQALDSNQYTADDRKVTSGFLGYLMSGNRIDAQANVRYDDYSDFDSETTYNVGAAYHLSPDLRLGANYAKGYRVPTFNDLYYPGSANPNLKPETSDNYEAFVEYNTSTQSTRLTGYRNKVDDIMTFVAQFDNLGNYIGGSAQNVDQADIEGLTFTSDWYIDDYLLGVSYDYQKAKDDSGKANDGNFLPFRPEHKGTAYLGYQLRDVDLRLEYQHVDDYYADYGNTESNFVEGYGLVNISGHYQLSPSLSMTARLNNVANKNYVTVPDYNAEGTNFYTSFTYTFD